MKQTILILFSICALNSVFAQWNYVSGSSGPIFYNGGLVGIGTTPSYMLDVNGAIHSNNGIYGDSYTAGNVGIHVRGQASGVNGDLVIQGFNQQAWWLTGAAGYLFIGGNNATEPAQGAINIDASGHVGINTLNTTANTFSINGTEVCDGITVELFSSNNPKQTPWADYVFDKGYQLPSLQSVAAYIAANHHLDGIPTTEEVKKDGLDLGSTQAKMLEKIEQLTLYTIDLQKQADQGRTENEKLVQLLQTQSQQLASLQQQIDELKKAAH